MASIHGVRLQALQKIMADQGVDCVAICNSPNLFYMTDYSPKKDERFQVAFIPQQGNPVLAVPGIYYPTSIKVCTIQDQRKWIDGIDMVGYVKDILSELGVTNGKIAIDDSFEFRAFNVISHAAPSATFVPASSLFMLLRMRKSQDEIDLMIKSGELSDWAEQAVLDRLFNGQSEAEQKTWLEFELAQREMREGFSNIIAYGENSVSAHHVSGDRKLRPGDTVLMDLGGAYHHYWSDITRTFHVGKPSQKFVDTYNRVREAQHLGFEAIKPGVRACDVHMVAWNYLDKYGLAQYFTHRLGHGVGLEGHELPNLSKDCTIILEPGMTFSCEPGVYFPGEFGIRIEDSVYVTETGAKSFNHFTKDLIVL